MQLETEASRTYVLYFEPPDEPEADPGEEFTLGEQHVSSVDHETLFVRDANGLAELAVPPGAPPSP